MNRDTFEAALTDILNAHDGALSALRAANRGMQEANGALTSASAAHARASAAHDGAIDQALEANRAALRLLRQLRAEG